jgi:hypothetical protein
MDNGQNLLLAGETSRGSRDRVGVTRKENGQRGDEAGMPYGPVAWKSGRTPHCMADLGPDRCMAVGVWPMVFLHHRRLTSPRNT